MCFCLTLQTPHRRGVGDPHLGVLVEKLVHGTVDGDRDRLTPAWQPATPCRRKGRIARPPEDETPWLPTSPTRAIVE